MPRKAKELSALEVKRLQSPGYYPVGKVPGLLLQVTDNGARSWLLRVMVAGKRREIGLGPYPAVPLALAHEKAQAMRDSIANGVDPIAQRQAQRQALQQQQLEEKRTAWTFSRCAEQYISTRETGWRNAKHAQQWRNTLAQYAYPVIGALPVRTITVAHVMQILEPHWATKTETMVRVRNRIELILDWAAVHGYRDQNNPARWKGCLDKLLPRPGTVAPVVNHRALPPEDMYNFVQRLQQVDGMSARCLEFVILCACRSGEARGAAWSEINWGTHSWTVPRERMKAGREHRVPLSAPAIILLKSLPRIGDSEFVFPGRNGMLSDMALTAVMRRLGADAVPHGFRATFSSWAASSTAYPSEVREMALAHTVGTETEQAYQRSDLFAKRRSLMADWAQFIAAPPARADGDVTGNILYLNK